jgi:D-alanyl-lipoteichoic acid acyltransferase DltB (MBOAT superfamily)
MENYKDVDWDIVRRNALMNGRYLVINHYDKNRDKLKCFSNYFDFSCEIQNEKVFELLSDKNFPSSDLQNVKDFWIRWAIYKGELTEWEIENVWYN